MRRFVGVAAVVLLGLSLLAPSVDATSQPVAGAPFFNTWARTDYLVTTGVVSRTWMWGPQADSVVLDEPYAESPGGMREVQYFDKSRMEITHPNGDPSSIWYVTNGLLAEELITGRMQLGDNTFHQYAPAQVNVAGDLNDPNGPTYASFSGLISSPPLPTGSQVTQTVNRAGQVGNDPNVGGVPVIALDTGAPTHHTVASVFWTFMTSAGPVAQDGRSDGGPLFQNPFYATGYPITEPYWTTVLVGGVSRQVLVQVFERRVLTYTPTNPPGWQVESGNVGLQYYQWRYVQLGLTPTPAPNPPQSPPSPSSIASVMARTVESNDPTEHFTPVAPLAVDDGQGGVLTAVVGTRYPTADGYGQLVFFWHNQSFLGWDSSTESVAIAKLTSPAPGVIAVTYVHYAPSDPLCCPSLAPVTVTYSWNGTVLQPSGSPPSPNGITVELTP
ncbi:MAG TPA: LppP/LprE family lipoprotein [Thermomicrobiaceae bacterium]|nr:LppP/LprE family lipoprotein [Thermomicrobiaceae bacterium]